MTNKKLLRAVEGKKHDRRRPYSRKELDRMGIPSDMTVDDVLAFFSLPDDDDSMHSARANQ